jgi:hypothetical protein
MTLLSQQCSFTPVYTIDSETTDFEEDSSDGLISVNSDRSLPDFTGNNLL